MMETLRNKMIEYEGSSYEQRIKEKPELLEFIKASIDKHSH